MLENQYIELRNSTHQFLKQKKFTIHVYIDIMYSAIVHQ